MLLEPFISTLVVFSEILLNKLWQLHDRNWTSDKYETKQTSIQNYVELYSGLEFELHVQCADILLIVGIAFFYGSAMPLMYFLALISLIIMYIRETLLIYYCYKQPPVYDFRATQVTFQAMGFIAFVSLPFIFWQLGNR